MRLSALFSLLIFAVSNMQGVVYDYAPDTTRKLRLNVPDGLSEVRGILIFGNGAGGDSTGSATNSELVACAKSLGFVVLATGYWSNFSGTYEIDLFEAALDYYAGVTGFSELRDAPWLPMGHSNGGQMSYGLNSLRPEKVIGFITSKGCCYNTWTPGAASLRTPGMLIAGAIDTTVRRTNIRALFDTNRPLGALWAWVEEENTGHEEANSQQLKLTFLMECCRLRSPRDQSPVNGPVKLKDLNEWDGWLVDHNTWTSGFSAIYRYDQYHGDKRSMGWVPTEKVACLYRSFSSYNRLTSTVSGSSGTVSAPATLTYQVDLTGKPWDKIEFFEGSTPIGTALPTDGNSPKVTFSAKTGGLYCFHAVVTRTDQTKSPTMLRRVFVQGPQETSAYDAWAKAAIPSGDQGRTAASFGDRIPNLVRWGFGLGAVPTAGQLSGLPAPIPEPVNIGGVEFVGFRYRMDVAARSSGALFIPQMSTDMVNWSRVEHGDLAEDNKVTRDEDTITAMTPWKSPVFFRVAVEDAPAR